MDLTLTSEEQAFRDQVRTWLEANHPGAEPDGEDAKFEFRRDWQRALERLKRIAETGEPVPRVAVAGGDRVPAYNR